MRRRRHRGKHFSQRGVALIAVLVALTLIGAVAYEFSTDTTNDMMRTYNAVDSVQAEFHTRSGANLAQLVIRVQTDVLDRFRNQIGDIQLADYIGLFSPAFGGSKEDAEALAAMIGGFQGDSIQGLGVDVGMFDVNIVAEDGKINLNCANGSQQTKETIKAQLDSLFFHDAYNPIFENPDATGWRRDRQTQASALIDYVDRDRTRFDAPGTPEDYGYENLDDSYEPKNNYIDSIGEIRMIRGVDDRFWTLFGGQFTVYGDCKLNIGSVQDARTFASMIFLSAQNPDDPVLHDPRQLWALARRVAEARALGILWDDLRAFADFVKNPDGALGELFGGALGAASAEAAAQVAEGSTPVVGVELDMNKLQQVAQVGPRRVYRVEVTAEVRRVKRRLTAIWDTATQNQNSRNPQEYGRGAWVFWRVD
jgi:type II secretory pathway component PulK